METAQGYAKSSRNLLGLQSAHPRGKTFQFHGPKIRLPFTVSSRETVGATSPIANKMPMHWALRRWPQQNTFPHNSIPQHEYKANVLVHEGSLFVCCCALFPEGQKHSSPSRVVLLAGLNSLLLPLFRPRAVCVRTCKESHAQAIVWKNFE